MKGKGCALPFFVCLSRRNRSQAQYLAFSQHPRRAEDNGPKLELTSLQ